MSVAVPPILGPARLVQLCATGMRDLHLLEGGTTAWVAAGLPVRCGA